MTDDSVDRYRAYQIGGKRGVADAVFSGSGSGERSYSFRLSSIGKKASSSYSKQMSDTVRANAQRLADASLVQIVKPSSKYNGMAGKVVTDGIKIRNDHVEFPVELEYDNGFRFTVWFTDDDVEIYLGG